MARQTHVQISIPEPCKVPWNSMSPVDSERRHCSSCDKVITNFSEMSDDELMLYFKHGQQNICGVFSNDQLNRRIKLLPGKTQKANWWKIMLLIPLSFFSKSAKAQYFEYVNGDKQSQSSIDTLSNPFIVENKIDTSKIAETKTDSIVNPSEVVAENNPSVDSLLTNISPAIPESNIIVWNNISGAMTITYGGFVISPYNPFDPFKEDGCIDESFNPEPTPSIWHLDFWGLLYRKTFRIPRNDDKLDKPDPLKTLADHKEKPKPEKSGLPASTDISGILPPSDRKSRRS